MSHQMNKSSRRTVLRQLFFISAGATLLPRCMEDKSKASIMLKNFSISADQESMLAEMAETIIPKTDTPGAKDISAHLFALKMVDDCYKKEDRDKFVKGLAAFESFAKQESGKAFIDADAGEREKVIAALNEDIKSASDLSFFYQSMKRLTIQAYTTSQFYLTKVNVYQLVPGRFKGCVPVSKI